MAELGTGGATVRRIAAEAGVSTGYVMHYFPDKQHLLDAVLVHANVRAGERAVAARGRRRGLNALTALIESIMPIDADRRLDWQVWSAFWTHLRPGEAAVDGLGFARKVATDLLQTCMEEAVQDGDLPATLDIPYEAERLVVLAAGVGLFSGATADEATGRRLVKRMVRDHLASLAGERAGTGA